MLAPSQSANSRAQSQTASRDRHHASNQAAPKADVKLYLTNCRSFYSCIYCRTHLANHDELVSRLFNGTTGRAYLFNSVVNIKCGATVQRQLNTGVHDVCDIHCMSCDTVLGWKYEKAFAESQRYKEGKYIIELYHVVRENRHLEFDKGAMCFGRKSLRSCSTSSSSSSAYSSSQSSSLNSTPPSSSPISQQQNNRIYSLLERLGFASSGCSNNTINNANPNNSNNSNRPAWLALLDDDNQLDNPETGPRSKLSKEKDKPDYDNFDEEDLIFPIYDDLCSSSNHPGRLSVSQHNRMRRSLYLDSTPYDWKFLATSMETDHDSAKLLGAREGAEYDKDSDSIKADDDREEDEDVDGKEDETQFKFEADRPEIELMPMASLGEDIDERQQSATDSEPGKTLDNRNIGPPEADQSLSSQTIESPSTAGMSQLAASSSAKNSVASQSGSSISLDEEEFYDCHAVWPLL